jgi:hypothetical protein
MKTLIYISLFLIPAAGFSQADVDPALSMQSQTVDAQFDQYCLKHALTVMEVPAAKAGDLVVDGTVPALLAADATYRDYQLTPVEGRTQYFRVQGTNKVLALKSLYVLRLNYANEKK